ncbi:MAG: efflux RND transporter periplasmic adaptor subunit [Deltaproteobacteria bacterium]|nr:efflux RND transporter periplasmic adaptor subunit [Kofleriaceae bacterium]
MSDQPSPPQLPSTSTERTHPMGIVLAAVVALLVLFAAIGIFQWLVATKPAPEKEDEIRTATPVEAASVAPRKDRMDVVASGTVRPARQVVLASEVGGKVLWMSPELVPGGRFKGGQPVIRLDGRDYRLALEQQAAAVRMAQTELAVEESRKRIAEKEWQLLGEKPPEPGSLALRDPQLETAKASVKAAQSNLRRTELALARTGLVAPWNAMVLQRAVDVGHIVAPGAPLATLAGTDAYWVEVAIPVDRLTWLDVPGIDGATTGSSARVVYALGDRIVERAGTVVRLAGEVDPVGRMARLLVEIPDPLAPDQPPLLLNAFVEVHLAGDHVDEIYELPRTALRDDGRVWLVADGKLKMQEVDVIWRRPSTVVVRGLSGSVQVITSPVPGATEGLAVRVVEPGKRGQTAKTSEPPQPAAKP